MPFEIGDKVQAVDENGHWGNAKVITVWDNKRTYTVHYIGWANAFDKEVREDSIRYRVLPMEQQNPASTRCAPGK